MNDTQKTLQERFLSSRQRYNSITLPQEFSDEDMATDWTFLTPDRAVLLEHVQKRYRPWSGIQLCAARLWANNPQLYDRTEDELTLDEIERIHI